MSGTVSASRVPDSVTPDAHHASLIDRLLCRIPRLSLGALPVIGCFVALYVVAIRPVTDPDVWWHLATGRYILTTGTIPHHDVFSFSARSHLWVTHEWLTEVILYWLQSHAGFGILMVLWAAVITAAFVVIYQLMRAGGGSWWIALPATLLAAAASSHTWGVRPQMLSLLLFAIYTALLWWPGGHASGSVPALSRRRQVALILLTLLWVNLHGGFIFGLLLIGLELVAAVVGAVVGPSSGRGAAIQRARALALTLTGCVIVGLLNPNTWRILLYPFSYLGNNASMRYVAEWVSPDFHQGNYLFFEALLFALLVGLAIRPRRPSPRLLLITLVFAYLGLESVRNIPLYCVVATPVIVASLQEAWQATRWARIPRQRRLVPLGRAIVNWVIVAVLVGATVTSVLPLVSAQAARRAEAAAYPTRAVAFMRSHPVPQPLFNSYNWGGYLIWTLYPRYLVYIDGRPDMYGDAYMDRFIAAYEGASNWRSILNSEHIASVLVEPSSILAKLLALSPGWHRLYADSQAVIYVRSPS